MIFRFVVDPEAVASCGTDVPFGTLETERLIRVWQQFGVLLIEPGRSGEQLLEAIDGLPQRLRVLWKKALNRLRSVDAPVNWQGVIEVQGAADFHGLQSSADLAYLDEVRWVIAGLDPSKYSEHLPAGMEFVRIGSIDSSRTVRDAEILAQKEIVRDTPTETVWRARFKEAVQHAKVVTIVDRYCISEDLRQTNSGLRKFLLNCDRDASGITVQIFASVPDFVEDGLVENNIIESLPALARGGIQQIQIHLNSDRNMSVLAHDRYVRFSTDYLIELGSGISVLRGQKTHRDCSFSMSPATSNRTKKEITMRAKANRIVRLSA